MYQDYFRLTDLPFSIAPDPRFLYMSARHREALAHLLYGVRGEGGFVLLTGEIGTGKTTLCRCLLEQIHRECDVALILNPKMGAVELLATVCEEFHIEVPVQRSSVKRLVDAINAHLLTANAAGRRAVLIIDEAQNLHPDVLEQLRLLTNLETNQRKLLQIILIGQPELQDMLRRPEMRQVAQRIVARCHLTHLTRSEISAYVNHRLRVSGAPAPLFPENLIGTLYRLTRGVPRLINLVCDRALLGTYVDGKLQVTRSILRQAAREVLAVSAPPHPWLYWSRRLAVLSALGAGGVFAGGYFLPLPSWPAAWSEIAVPARTTAAEPAARPSAETTAVKVAVASPVPPAAGAAEPTASPAPAKLPDTPLPLARSERSAFQGLFKLYGLDYEPDGKDDPCSSVVAITNLRCLEGNGNLAYLLRFNQPAVLLMNGSEGPYHAVLVAQDGDTATLLGAAGERQRVRLTDIAAAWSGRFVLLWHKPPGFTVPLTLNSSGPAVSWLRAALAKLSGGKAEGPAVVDQELVRRVMAFQLAEGITSDGIAGALTLIRLNARLDRSLPRLVAELAQGSHVLHP